MDGSAANTSWERVGALASELAACAADIERFLLDEAARLQRLQRQLKGQAHAEQRRLHPGSADPLLASVLSRFEQLERLSSETIDENASA